MSKIRDDGDRAHWEERYRESSPEELPWFHPELDHDISIALKELDIKDGDVLDLGCGPGTQAIELARMGFNVTASDIAEAALTQARLRAKLEGVELLFVRDDILNTIITGPFDLIIDRGCFHVLPKERFKDYAKTIHGLLKEDGWLLLKCFSHKERREEGPPNRLSPQEIRLTFEELFCIHTLKESHFAARDGEAPPKALFCILQKLT